MARPRATESEAVLDAAVRQLTEHGIAGTTIDDVAAAAGVSRATVYRYVGGKSDIVSAAILRESTVILEQVAGRIRQAPTASAAIADGVHGVLTGIEEHPLLARLTTRDLVDTLPYLTVDSAPLVAIGVTMLTPAMVESESFEVREGDVHDAIEEAARFVFAHLTTPRRDGARRRPAEAGARAAELIVGLLVGDQR